MALTFVDSDGEVNDNYNRSGQEAIKGKAGMGWGEGDEDGGMEAIHSKLRWRGWVQGTLDHPPTVGRGGAGRGVLGDQTIQGAAKGGE